MSETFALFSAAVVTLGTLTTALMTYRRDHRTYARSAFDEMRSLKEEYQRRSEGLEKELAELRAKITLLEERSKKLEQENIELRLEIARLKGAI